MPWPSCSRRSARPGTTSRPSGSIALSVPAAPTTTRRPRRDSSEHGVGAEVGALEVLAGDVGDGQERDVVERARAGRAQDVHGHRGRTGRRREGATGRGDDEAGDVLAVQLGPVRGRGPADRQRPVARHPHLLGREHVLTGRQDGDLDDRPVRAERGGARAGLGAEHAVDVLGDGRGVVRAEGVPPGVDALLLGLQALLGGAAGHVDVRVGAALRGLGGAAAVRQVEPGHPAEGGLGVPGADGASRRPTRRGGPCGRWAGANQARCTEVSASSASRIDSARAAWATEACAEVRREAGRSPAAACRLGTPPLDDAAAPTAALRTGSTDDAVARGVNVARNAGLDTRTLTPIGVSTEMVTRLLRLLPAAPLKITVAGGGTPGT